jgi:phenylacetic acid degradation operon negative regulatory protein
MDKHQNIVRKRKIQSLSWGLTTRISELVLLQLFLGLNLLAPSKHTSKFLGEVFGKIHTTLDEELIRRVFYQLKKQGLITYAKRLWQQPQITKQGLQRLNSILPGYDSVRAWDNRLYLITYDIPEKNRPKRDKLRRFLKQIGCGLLQESVWLTPYNPRQLLKEFIVNNDLIGLVLVSDLGKDGSIGEEDTLDLIERVYHLSEINLQYQQFIRKWLNQTINDQAVWEFLSILANDPQLPFELLPDNWQGEKAWQIIQPVYKTHI